MTTTTRFFTQESQTRSLAALPVVTVERHRSLLTGRLQAFEFDLSGVLQPTADSAARANLWRMVQEHLDCFPQAAGLLRMPLRHLENPGGLMQLLKQGLQESLAGRLSLMLTAQAGIEPAIAALEPLLSRYRISCSLDAVHAGLPGLMTFAALPCTWLKIDALTLREWGSELGYENRQGMQDYLTLLDDRGTRVSLAAEALAGRSTIFADLPLHAVCRA